jgi:hypothetical protein
MHMKSDKKNYMKKYLHEKLHPIWKVKGSQRPDTKVEAFNCQIHLLIEVCEDQN